jgi:hypothetical protein
MLVTCCICGKKIEKDTAYKAKVVVNKRTGEKELKYKNCCSEQEWQAEEDRKKKAKEDKDRVYYLICDMWGYEIQNTKFFDEWRYWNKLKSNEIIYKYLRENETYLQQICDRSYNNEYSRIRYFSAILKNELRDFKPKPKVEEKPKVVVEEIIYETPNQSLNKRRSLDDLEDMF